MLKNIKSLFFIRELFTLISDKAKLKIVIYNKNLQNTINIRLINYKVYSGKYIIFEKDKIGKLYNGYDDRLLFEGEFLHGKKNGKGKEYTYDGKLIFEGEYLNGIINGKCKEYYSDGKIKFEGEYKNGLKNGEGNLYYSNGKIKFKGEYLEGKNWNGKTFDYFSNKTYEIKDGSGFLKDYDYLGEQLEYEGQYSNGERNGKGKQYYPDGNIMFEGEFINNQWNGKGKKYNENGQLLFEGQYNNGIAWNGISYDYDTNTMYNIKNGKIVNNDDNDNDNDNDSNYSNNFMVAENQTSKINISKSEDKIIVFYFL